MQYLWKHVAFSHWCCWCCHFWTMKQTKTIGWQPMYCLRFPKMKIYCVHSTLFICIFLLLEVEFPAVRFHLKSTTKHPIFILRKLDPRFSLSKDVYLQMGNNQQSLNKCNHFSHLQLTLTTPYTNHWPYNGWRRKGGWWIKHSKSCT